MKNDINPRFVSYRQLIILAVIKDQISEAEDHFFSDDNNFGSSDEDFSYLKSEGFVFVDNDHSYPSPFLTELGEKVLAHQRDSIPKDFDYEKYFITKP